TADNSWWRRFYFNEHPTVGASAAITAVTVSSGSNVVPGGLPITINLYTLAHSTAVDTIPTASLNLIGTATGVFTNGLDSVTIPVTGLVSDTAGLDLVVEYHTDGSPDGQFFPGANATPETHPTFISSAACSINAPTKTADIGFPDFHLTMVVTLDEGGTPTPGCDNPADVPWLSTSPSSGTVVPGGSENVAVSVNASTLAVGEYSANLCVGTNDPMQSMIVVPVTVTVDPAPIADFIFCSGFEMGEDGSCGPPQPVGDIYSSGPINHVIANDSNGTSVNWITRDIQDGVVANYHFNPYNNNAQLTFWWQTGAADIAGVSSGAATSNFLFLQAGGVVGPSSVWSTTSNPGSAAWRTTGTGYLGFRFNCSSLSNPPASGICYGYVRISTTAPAGFPATILNYSYDRTGAAITIP
ncbi:MAG: hypothetical protein ABIY56_02825, partial [Dokdonella sp.]